MAQAKSKSTTQRRPRDPLVDIGRKIVELDERYQEIDRRPIADDPEPGKVSERVYRDAELRDLYDRIVQLRGYASTLRATSLEGALVQIGIADSIFNHVSELTDGEAENEKLRFRRLIFSAVKALAGDLALGDVDPTALGVYLHLGEHLDPWRPYEQRVAEIEAAA